MAFDILALIALIALAALFKIHDWQESAKTRAALVRTNEGLLGQYVRLNDKLIDQNRELVRMIALSKGVAALDKYLTTEQMLAGTPPPEPLEPEMQPLES